MINFQELENLLIKNWTTFLDPKKFINLITESALNASLPISERPQSLKLGTQVKLSRFTLTEQGFILWADFIIAQKDKTAIGTVELLLSSSGVIQPIQTVGNAFLTKRPPVCDGLGNRCVDR